MSLLIETRNKTIDNMIVMVADHRNGEKGSLYIKATGRQKRYVIVSMSRIMLRIRTIIKGLISLICGLKSSKIVNANNFVLNRLNNLFLLSLEKKLYELYR